MSARNAYQVSDWNGRNGERWVANQRRLDAMLEAYGEAALAAAAPMSGERVLDIGCGAGASSFALAECVRPGGSVLGLDISEPLVARALELVPPDIELAFRVADASTTPLPPQDFDLIFSRFGVMFFDDPVAAFAHMRKALKPGGRLAFVCWRGAAENDWIRLPMGAVRSLLPPSPPPAPDAPGPFSFGDSARVMRILREAGFERTSLVPLDSRIPFGEGADREAALDDALDMAFEVGPLTRALADQPEDVIAAARKTVRAAFAACPGDTSVMIEGAAWIVTARNPAA